MPDISIHLTPVDPADVSNPSSPRVAIFPDSTNFGILSQKDSAGVVTSLQGPAGANGADGADGTDGADGANGAPGSITHHGTGAPGGGLGVDIDYYIDDSNGDLYSKSTGSWVLISNIKGPAGNDGADGVDGADGNDGAPGADGADGTIWSDGTAAPSGGNDGDYYLKTDTNQVYQKVAGVWTLKWTAPASSGGAGSLKLLGIYPATAAANIVIDTRNATGTSGAIFQSDCSHYLFRAVGLTMSSASAFGIQFSTGSAFITTATYTGDRNISLGGFVNVPIGTDRITCSPSDTMDTGASSSIDGWFEVFDPLNTTFLKRATGEISGKHSGGAQRHVDFHGTETSNTNALDAVRLAATGGNFPAGVILAYGYVNS